MKAICISSTNKGYPDIGVLGDLEVEEASSPFSYFITSNGLLKMKRSLKVLMDSGEITITTSKYVYIFEVVKES